MGIRRACSYTARFQPPQAPGSYSAVLVTILQNGEIMISKHLEDLTIANGKFVMQLTQEETALLDSSVETALMQIRCYASEYDAPGSRVFAVEVWPALDDTILPNSGGNPEEVEGEGET